MNYKIVEKESLTIVGISVRTTNQNGQAMKDIGELWNRFIKENIKDKITNKIDDEVYSVYTDYEGDFTKPYTVIIGCKVPHTNNIPNNMQSKIIPNSTYAVFTAKGKIPEAIIDTWQTIWHEAIKRSYTNDFELYDDRSKNMEHAEVDIYIAINQ
ncbi:MAG: GyrI-like domain-containing protein [Alphaproteobacteria bacterium]|nr:GyrI-like domain-containing protein [Alphaproteobacteria bacterium]